MVILNPLHLISDKPFVHISHLMYIDAVVCNR